MRTGQRIFMAAALALAAILSGCGDDGRAQEDGPGADTIPGDSGPPPGELPQGVSADVGATGRRLYRAACVMCHGEGGGGTQLGPSLVDGEWLQGGGGFEEMVQVVQQGVAEPQEFPVPMPPRGNGALSDEQVRAVAAYTYSLSRRGGGTAPPAQ